MGDEEEGGTSSEMHEKAREQLKWGKRPAK